MRETKIKGKTENPKAGKKKKEAIWEGREKKNKWKDRREGGYISDLGEN